MDYRGYEPTYSVPLTPQVLLSKPFGWEIKYGQRAENKSHRSWRRHPWDYLEAQVNSVFLVVEPSKILFLI